MSETSNRPKPSGWYPDPEDAARLRKWDGVGWTDSWMGAATGTTQARDGGPVGAALGSGAMVYVAGWHLDPYAPTSGRERFWDGAQWTPRLRYGSVFPGRAALGSGFFTLAAWLRGLFYVQVAVSAVGVLTAAWIITVLNRWMSAPETITLDEANTIDAVDLGVSGVGGLLNVVIGVLFVTWLWKAYSSNRVDPSQLHHGRGWTIGAWFVPILNLFRPFQLVRDLRDGIRSAMGATGPDHKRWLVRAWWAAFLTMYLLDLVARVVDSGAATAEGLDLISGMRTLTWLSFASSLASIVAAALAALVVYRLTAGLRPVEYLEPVE